MRPLAMLVALFGITNEGLNLFVNLVVLFLVVVWIALVAWTFLDARRRIEDPVLVACATGASLFPFVGHDRLHDPASARVPRGRPRARAGDPRRGAPRQAARGAVLPQLRLPDRAHLPALSGLQGPGEGPVRVLPEADRPALDDLPLLRDAAATRRSASRAAPSPPAALRRAEPRPRARRRARPKRTAAAERARPLTARPAEPRRPAALGAPRRVAPGCRRRQAQAGVGPLRPGPPRRAARRPARSGPGRPPPS